MSWERTPFFAGPRVFASYKLPILRGIVALRGDPLDEEGACTLVILIKHYHEGYFQLVF